MKRHLLFKSLLLLCALIVGTNAWANNNVSTVSTTFSATGNVTGKFTQTGDFTNASWNLDVTWKSTASWQNLDGTKGSQVGSGKKPATGIVLTGSNIPGTITSVVVNTSGASDVIATVAVTVGGTGFTCGGNTTASLTSSAANYTFTGTGSGDIVITWANSSDKAIYIKSITTTYSAEEVVAAPTFSPVAGEVTKGSTVTLTQDAADQIRYTLDGTDPTKSKGSVYSSPIVINEATVIKAIAIKGDKVSDVATAAYSVAYPKVLTLDMTDAGWEFPDAYDTTEKSYTNNGYTITLGASSNGHKVVKNGEDIVSLIYGKTDATLTLPAFGFNVSKIKVYGCSGASSKTTFNVYVGDVAVSTQATDATKNHDFVIAADKQAAGTIYTIKVTNANNCQISKIEVYGNGCEAGLVQSYGWATYIPTANVEYPANTAYIVTDASVSSGLTLEEVTEVPTGTPILLKGAGAKTAIALDAAPSVNLSSNLLSVSNGLALSEGSYPYVLAKNGASACFKKWTGDMSDLDGRVMLVLDENIAAARGIFDLDSETTAIETVKAEKANNEYYNLAGQRVANPTKGLYIVNGRKVVIK